ncbi:DoxX family protein [Borborobacter arsenicus]|nr:DoxX family protein [Pseudaminobacter arsenicus]
MLEQITVWALVLIFVGSAYLNLTGPEFVKAEFAHWNYPPWLRLAVGIMELAAAAGLLFATSRSLGALLALAILAGVVFSLGKTQEWLRMQFPLLMGALCIGLIL